MSNVQVLMNRQVVAGRVRSDSALLPDAAKPVIVAGAPGRLDVMGGIAEDGGSLVLQTSIDRMVTLACQRREDMHVVVRRYRGDAVDECVWPLAVLYGHNDALATLAAFASGVGEPETASGVLYALLEAECLPHFGGGVTIVYDSAIPADAGLGESSAIAVATVQAMSGLFNLQLKPAIKARIASRAARAVGLTTDDAAAALTSLLAQPDTLLQVRCQPDDLIGPLTLPDGVKVLGIDSGVRKDTGQRHTETRVAAHIGRQIIADSALGAPGHADPTRGYLANVSPEEFVQRHRDLLPSKLSGRDAVARHGINGDPRVTIVPDRVYKARSRTEHYIYDNRRAQQFAASIARAARTRQDAPLAEAGQFMYASHWSYSQRCGLATLETDTLVNLIRQHGDEAGLFGARLSDIGAGGAVVVLMRSDARAADALAAVLGAYQAKTGIKPEVYPAGAVGAEAMGWQRFD